MPSTLPILRARRERRLARQRLSEARKRNSLLSVGIVLSLLIAACITTTAFSYGSLTNDLPSIDVLPQLLNPPDGLLLQPTRIYDRTRKNILFTFAPNDAPRRYIPLSDANPQHLPSLTDAVIAPATVWRHPGYTVVGIWSGITPTLAQRLVFDLLLFDEPPSLRRALRERILAAQITAKYGRTQILEWYLNLAHFGRYAFGAENAAQLYFGKSVTQLSTFETAILPGERLAEPESVRCAQTAPNGRGTVADESAEASSEATAALGNPRSSDAASQPQPAAAFTTCSSPN
jgi:membrane carboxypeptidase/penicillin-binding protein